MENTTAQFSSSIEQFWYNIVDYLPRLLAAAIVLFIGLILAASLGRLVKKLVSYTKIDELIDRMNINKYLADSGMKFCLPALFLRLLWALPWLSVWAAEIKH